MRDNALVTSPQIAGTWEAERTGQLVKSRRRATGLLVLTVLLFVATHLFTDGRGWWGFVQAAAEAGVVGGIADWFAVTALFRRNTPMP